MDPETNAMLSQVEGQINGLSIQGNLTPEEMTEIANMKKSLTDKVTRFKIDLANDIKRRQDSFKNDIQRDIDRINQKIGQSTRSG